MASPTRSPSTPGTKTWKLAKIRPMKQRARIMMEKRISILGDLGGITGSLKITQLGTYSKKGWTQLILTIMTLLRNRRTWLKLTTLSRTIDNILQHFSLKMTTLYTNTGKNCSLIIVWNLHWTQFKDFYLSAPRLPKIGPSKRMDGKMFTTNWDWQHVPLTRGNTCHLYLSEIFTENNSRISV